MYILILALQYSAFSFPSIYIRLPATSYLKMIDIWFVALMLIPSVEVILHTFGYLSRIKLSTPSTPCKPCTPCKQTQFGNRLQAKLKIGTRLRKKLQIGTRVQQNFSLALDSEEKSPSKECWNEASRSNVFGHYLKRSRTFCSIFLPIFFFIFLVIFISTGILLKHKLIWCQNAYKIIKHCNYTKFKFFLDRKSCYK